jgi:hypothetical protein
VRHYSLSQIFLALNKLLKKHRGWMLLFLLFCASGEAWGNQGETQVRWVDSFSAGTRPGKEGVPPGWALEGTPGPHSKILLRPEEGGYLALVSMSDSFGLRKEMAFDLADSPQLSWRWRVPRHPEGGDIRQKSKDDQAGQIYVIFGRFPLLLNYRAMGYIWDPAAPVGFSGISRTYSRMRYMVIRSGAVGGNGWIEETRELKTDYEKLFQEAPPPVAGVMLFLNTNLTGSLAECHYKNIFFSKPSRRVAPAGTMMSH